MSFYECEFCGKKYVSEGHYKKHECEQMRRHNHLKTPKGVAAYEAYSAWLNAKGYANRGTEQFMESRYYTSFVKFIDFSQRMALPAKDIFIRYMAKIDMLPKDWTSNLVYDHYIDEFDTLLSPDEQASVTVDTIFELARNFECDPDDVFLYLEANSLIKIVQAKKMSPWVLMFSPKFRWFMSHEMTREQRILLEQYVKPERWEAIFNTHPDEVDKMKTYVRALGI